MQQANPLVASPARDQRRSRTPFTKRTHHQQQQRPQPAPAPQPAASSSSSPPLAALLPSAVTQPSPTARALVPEGADALRQLAERAEIVTVRSTIQAAPTAGSSKATPVPVGPIVGGVLAGVAVVLLAAGVWWWWVANKPRQRQHQQRTRSLPSTKAGVVPPPVSYARSRPSTSSAVKGSLEKVPLTTLSSGAPAALAKDRGGAPASGGGGGASRNVSGSSTAPLVPSGADSSSSPATSPVKKKWSPATPSPLALGAVVSVPSAVAADVVPEPPRWGQAPFASVPAPSASGGSGKRASGHLSASGHSHGGSTDGGNSASHLYVPRSASGPIYEEGGSSSQGHQQKGGPNSNRYSNISDASRYSQPDGYDRRLSSISDGHSANHGGWGGSRGHEGYAAPPAQAYGAGYDGGSQYRYGGGQYGAGHYGGGVGAAYGDPYATGGPGNDGQEYVSDRRTSDGYRLDNYYQPQ